jgi:hypothetical protein
MSDHNKPELTCLPVVLKNTRGEYLSLGEAQAPGWKGIKVLPCKPDDPHLAGWTVYEMSAGGKIGPALSVHKTARLAGWDIESRQVP